MILHEILYISPQIPAHPHTQIPSQHPPLQPALLSISVGLGFWVWEWGGFCSEMCRNSCRIFRFYMNSYTFHPKSHTQDPPMGQPRHRSRHLVGRRCEPRHRDRFRRRRLHVAHPARLPARRGVGCGCGVWCGVGEWGGLLPTHTPHPTPKVGKAAEDAKRLPQAAEDASRGCHGAASMVAKDSGSAWPRQLAYASSGSTKLAEGTPQPCQHESTAHARVFAPTPEQVLVSGSGNVN